MSAYAIHQNIAEDMSAQREVRDRALLRLAGREKNLGIDHPSQLVATRSRSLRLLLNKGFSCGWGVW